MQQLVLDLSRPAPKTFASFRPGRNAEALAALREVAAGAQSGKVAYLWGAEGSGKSHLLQAVTTAAVEFGSGAVYVDLRGENPAEALSEGSAPMSSPTPWLLALDHIDEANDTQQSAAFTAFNRTRQAGGSVVAAGRCPVIRLPLREDLRTRVGWGPSFEVLPLSDDEKRDALLDAAAHRGIGLPFEVGSYLLRHGPRDLASLLAILAAADRLSLAERRPLTIPLLKVFLRDEDGSGAGAP